MSDDDSPLEEDEEEILAYVEFEGTPGPSTFCIENLQLDMIGLDMEHPIMQVNGKYYEGTYEDAVGTYMFFEKDDNPIVDDPVFDKMPTIKYFSKTRKILKMKRVFVKPRLEVLGDSDDQACIPNLETVKEAGVPPKYQKEALQLWKQIRYDRLTALNKYLEKQRLRKEKRQQGVEPDSDSDDDNPFVMYKSDAKILGSITQSTSDLYNSASSTKSSYDQLTVIDPGPSTSKDSHPWVSPTRDPLQDNESDDSQPRIHVRNQGYIEVLQKKRPRKVLKVVKKLKNRKTVSRKPKVTKPKAKKTGNKRIKTSVDEKVTIEGICEPMDVDRGEEVTEKGRKVTVSENELMTSNSNDKNFKIEEQNEVNDKNYENEINKASTQADEVCQRVGEMEISMDNQSENSNDVEIDELEEKKLEKQRKREAKMREISERLRKSAEEIKARAN